MGGGGILNLGFFGEGEGGLRRDEVPTYFVRLKKKIEVNYILCILV